MFGKQPVGVQTLLFVQGREVWVKEPRNEVIAKLDDARDNEMVQLHFANGDGEIRINAGSVGAIGPEYRRWC